MEAVASSLTGLFSPKIIAERLSGRLVNYDWITAEALACVKFHADTVEQQQAVLASLTFKCHILWSQLAPFYVAYVDPLLPAPGAFDPVCSPS